MGIIRKCLPSLPRLPLLHFSKDKWVHLRKSNTEPIIRIYSEAPEKEQAKDLIDKIKSLIWVGSLSSYIDSVDSFTFIPNGWPKWSCIWSAEDFKPVARTHVNRKGQFDLVWNKWFVQVSPLVQSLTCARVLLFHHPNDVQTDRGRNLLRTPAARTLKRR